MKSNKEFNQRLAKSIKKHQLNSEFSIRKRVIMLHSLGVLNYIKESQGYLDYNPVAYVVARMLNLKSTSSIQPLINAIMQNPSSQDKNNPLSSEKSKLDVKHFLKSNKIKEIEPI